MLNSSFFPSIDNSIIDNISHVNNSKHDLFALRDDLIHNIISGNKWRKLKFAIERIKNEELSGIQTYGGAFSNHLLATACAAKLYHIPCRIFVRGDELTYDSNEVLTYCNAMDVELHFLSRKEYQQQKLRYGKTEDGFLSIPEGGSCTEGLKGVYEMGECLKNYDVVALAQGTATTSLGILLSTPINTEIWAFPALKGFNSLQEMELLARRCGVDLAFQEQKHRICVMSHYSFGGYAKGQEKVVEELRLQKWAAPFPLDFVYTAKAFLGFMKESQKIEKSQRMIFIHTGGYAINRIPEL